MKHYLDKLEETVRSRWTQKALCDYRGDEYTYADVARSIEEFRLFLATASIERGTKVAICGRNSARWAISFWGVNVGGCVAVPGSCGKPVHEIRIDSDDPAHIVGEIQAQGANMTIGYYKNPEADAAAFTEDGWFRTGDLGLMDEDGNIFIRGRIKSMILNSSGQNIYPEELEAVLAGCPYVAESLVLDRGGKIVALVYPELPDGTDREAEYDIPERIRSQANRSLPSYSQIAKVELVDRPFEKTPKMSIKRYLYK